MIATEENIDYLLADFKSFIRLCQREDSYGWKIADKTCFVWSDDGTNDIIADLTKNDWEKGYSDMLMKNDPSDLNYEIKTTSDINDGVLTFKLPR